MVDMEKITFTRDMAKDIIKVIKRTHPRYINIGIRGNKVIIVERLDVDGFSKLISEPIVMLNNRFKWGCYIRVGEDEKVYEQLTSEQYKQIEDFIYYTVNKALPIINKFGFVVSDTMIHCVQELIGLLKYLYNVEYVDFDYVEAGYSEELIKAYITADEPYFSKTTVKEDGKFKVKNKRTLNEHLKKVNVNRVYDDKQKKFILDTVKELLNVRTDYEGAIVNSIQKGSKYLEESEIIDALSVLLHHIDGLRFNTILIRRHKEKLEEFKEIYENRTITSIKSVIHKNRPYVLVKGDLSDFTYVVGRGNYEYQTSFADKPGVTKVEDGCLMTVNAFLELTNTEIYYTQKEAIDVQKGDWERLFYVNKKYYRSISKNLVKAIDYDINNVGDGFTIIEYNTNLKHQTCLGSKSTVFEQTFLNENDPYGSGSLDEDSDNYYEILKEIAEVDSSSEFAHRFNKYKAGYEMRNAEYDAEEAKQFEKDKEFIEKLYEEMLPTLLKKLAPQVKQYTGKDEITLDDLKELDRKAVFGLDSGFVFTKYESNTLQQKYESIERLSRQAVREGELPKGSELKGIDRATYYPRVQSITIAGTIARAVAEEYNKRNPRRKIYVYTQLD